MSAPSPPAPTAKPSRRKQPRYIRIFLASPGDVAAERAAAMEVIERLSSDPLLRDRVTLKAVAWDEPGAGPAMRAGMTPQEAIRRGLPRPSECDFVVVILWSRLGTLLPADAPPEFLKPDGGRYLSGTEWEYDDGMRGKAEGTTYDVLVYRRTEHVVFDDADPEVEEKREQFQRVEEFFAGFRNPDGSYRAGVNPYAAPDDFREEIDRHLRQLINEILTGRRPKAAAGKAKHPPGRPSPVALQALHDAVTAGRSPSDLPSETLDAAAGHSPHDLVHYRLSRIAWWSRPRYALDKHFVRLTLTAQAEHAIAGQKPLEYRELREVMAVTAKYPAIVLLGAPGSGKSTLLGHLELDLATEGLQGRSDVLTFLVELRDYKPTELYNSRGELDKLIPSPGEWLAAEWRRRFSDLPSLDEVQSSDTLWMLIDGLNEMPHGDAAGYHHRVKAWQEYLAQETAAHPGGRYIFSCRRLDFSDPLNPKGLYVPQVNIEPLSPELIREFLTTYAPEQAADVWNQLSSSPSLALFNNPFFLTLLIGQVKTTGRIPGGLAELFTGYVWNALKREVEGTSPLFDPGALLSRRDCARAINPDGWEVHGLPEEGCLFPKLAELAFALQDADAQREGSHVRAKLSKVLALLAHERADDILRAGEALLILDEPVLGKDVQYYHQLLQEYFAARHLAAEPDAVARAARVSTEWREDRVTPNLANTLAERAEEAPLPTLPSTGWEETTVLAVPMSADPAAYVRALMEINLPMAARCAAQPDSGIPYALKDEVRWSLIRRTEDPGSDLRARIAAGLALGNLGDPRFERRTGRHGKYLLPPLVNIAGGTYTIGGTEGWPAERPVHEVELTPFALGKFPITNAEWALFMAAGGYDEEHWWDTEDGRRWQAGDPAMDEAIRTDYRRLRSEAINESGGVEAWIKARPNLTKVQMDWWRWFTRLSDEELKHQLDQWYPRGRKVQPLYWNHEAYNNPAQPVVGICWYEARAFCAWLAAQTGLPFRLPTEVEWEAAARGSQGRRYAYGMDFDQWRCNTYDTHVRRTTPVGVFPGGETPEGLADMAGNVWEWTSSIWGPDRNETAFPYPYLLDDGRENAEASPDWLRVVRGGSWRDRHGGARAAFRLSVNPDDRLTHLGFRVAAAAPIT
jgi:formylglycine-generating enzyme required for sulfatase activity